MQIHGITPDNGMVIDGEVICLKKDIYEVWQDDCINVLGCFCSNTATKEENPDGMRRTAIYVKKGKNVVVDGNGATLLIHGVMTPFIFDGCENITLKNITIDYARPTMSEFFVESEKEGEYVILPNDDCLYDIVDNQLIWHGERGKNGEYFWQHAYRQDYILSMYKEKDSERIFHFPRYKGNMFPSVPAFSHIERTENGLKVRLKEGTLPVGCMVQTRNTVRDQLGGFCNLCKNVRLENVTVRSMHGFGLLFQYCDGVTLNGVTVTPRRGRTVASNADFFHFSGCKGLVLVKDCTLSDGHDDFINVHGTHLRIIENKGKQMLVRFVNPNSWGFPAFFAGDKVEWIDKNTVVPYGGGKVVKAETVNETDILLTLSKPSKARAGDYVENCTWTPRVRIENNFFGTTACRAILCTTRKPAYIKNNRFYKVGSNVLCIEDDCNFWFESGRAEKIVMENNIFEDCGYGDGKNPVPVILVNPQVMDSRFCGGVHGEIVLKNNTFTLLSGAQADMDVQYTEKLVLKDNAFNRAPVISAKAVGKVEVTP